MPWSKAIDSPLSISLADHLTPEERDQILQTVEMFETITAANPEDYQSLEILKEAYWKIGRQEDGLTTSRKLAEVYMKLGQYSSALMEYQEVLQQQPDAEDVRSALAELEGRFGSKREPSKGTAIALDFGIEETEAAAPPLALASEAGHAPATAEEPSLIATPQTQMPQHMPVRGQSHLTLEHDGNEPLAKFLIQHRLLTHEVVDAAMEKVRTFNAAPGVKEGERIATSLLYEIGKTGADLEALLSGIIDRTKFAYAPLENYDVDRQIVRMLPENLTLGRLIVPFDIVSRTMMVAVDNPFDAGARAAVQQMVDYHIQWHLALPHVIVKILRGVYRIAE